MKKPNAKKPNPESTPAADVLDAFPAKDGTQWAAALEKDAKIFRETDRLTKESWAAAIGYWIGYPGFLYFLDGMSWPDENKSRCRHALESTYYWATRALAVEARRLGLDGAAMIQCSRVVMNYYRNNPPMLRNSTVWPDCLVDRLNDLTDREWADVRSGIDTFDRITLAAGTEKAEGDEERATAKPDESVILLSETSMEILRHMQKEPDLKYTLGNIENGVERDRKTVSKYLKEELIHLGLVAKFPKGIALTTRGREYSPQNTHSPEISP